MTYLIATLETVMENKNHVSIKSPKENSNIKHIKYILNDKELIQVFVFLFL